MAKYFVYFQLLKSILVLRIHMYEIEKVNELCQDFADRYIETLKIKLNSDNIFKGEDEDDLNEMNSNNQSDEKNFDEDNSELNSSHKSSSKSSCNFNNGDNLENNENKKQARSFKAKTKLKNTKLKSTSTPVKNKTPSPVSHTPGSFESIISPETSLAKISFNMLNLNSNNDCSYQSLGSNDLEDEMNDGSDSCNKSSRDNNDCFENDEFNNNNNNNNNNDEANITEDNEDNDEENIYDDEDDLNEPDDDDSIKSPKSLNTSRINKSLKINNNTNSSDDSYFKRNLKTKRGILPKNATTVMKKWLFQHIVVIISRNKSL